MKLEIKLSALQTASLHTIMDSNHAWWTRKLTDISMFSPPQPLSLAEILKGSLWWTLKKKRYKWDFNGLTFKARDLCYYMCILLLHVMELGIKRIALL